MIKQILIYFFFIYLLNYISTGLEYDNNKQHNNSHKISSRFKKIIDHHNNKYNNSGGGIESSSFSVNLWVYFNSKDDGSENVNGKLEKLVSKESIKRRLNRSTNDNIYDDYDIPVSEKTISEIVQCSNKYNSSIQIKVKSNWLNSVSIILRDNNNKNNNSINNTINCIVSNDNIKSIEIVESIRLSKEFIKTSQESTNEDPSSTGGENHPYYGKLYNYIKQIGIDKLHNMGYDGYGIKILMIDTGFWKIHKVFESMKIIQEFNFINNSENTTNPYNKDQEINSDNFHGTAVLSVIGGRMVGEMVGPAYNASFYLAKILDDEKIFVSSGVSNEDAFIGALEFAERNGIDLVSSSIGNYDTSYYETNMVESPLSIATSILVSKGVVFVNSAGNDGELNMGVCEPSNHKDTISVGAVDDTGIRAYFSSTGPNAEGILKPDLMAGGYSVYCADIFNDTGFSYYSGTSFAAPLLSGGIALLLQAHPTWNVNQIRNALLSTSTLSNRPNKRMGYGIVDFYAALNYKQPLSIRCDDELNSGSICSDRGVCCNGKCVCPEAYYGDSCQYKKVPCGDECNFDFNSQVSNVSKCQINQFNYESFQCVLLNNTKQLITYNNPYIINFNCDDNNNIINSSSKPFYSLLVTIIIAIIIII